MKRHKFLTLFEAFIEYTSNCDTKKQTALTTKLNKYLKENKLSRKIVGYLFELDNNLKTIDSKDKINVILEHYFDKTIPVKIMNIETNKFVKFLKNNKITINEKSEIENHKTELFESFLTNNNLEQKISFVSFLENVMASNIEKSKEPIQDSSDPVIKYSRLTEAYIFDTTTEGFKASVRTILDEELAKFKDNQKLSEPINKTQFKKHEILTSTDKKKILEGAVYICNVIDELNEYQKNLKNLN